MRPVSRSVLILAALATLVPAAARTAPAAPKPPVTRVEMVRDTLHGTIIEDAYRWLEDQDSPATRAWIEGQNAFTRSQLDAQPGREAIRARLAALLQVDAMEVPQERGGRYFFERRRADQDQYVIYWREGEKGGDKVLLDPHPLSPEHTTSASLLEVAPDGKLVAVGLRQGGQDEVTVSFLQPDDGVELDEHLPRGRYFNFAFTPDHGAVYYARFLPEGGRVYRHRFGTDPATDSLVFGADLDPSKIPTVEISDDGRWLLIAVRYGSSGTRIDLHLLDLTGATPPRFLTEGIEASFQTSFAGDHLILQTNWKAPNWRVLAVDLAQPEQGSWKEIVPASDAVIYEVQPAGGRIAVASLKDVLPRVRLVDLTGRVTGEIKLPGLGAARNLGGRWDGPDLFLTFSSFMTPTTILRASPAIGTTETWWQPKVPLDPADYEVRQVWYPSKDGTKVPMFLVMRAGSKPDGTHPLVLTGYGGFNQNQTPRFGARWASWVQMGGVLAVANLRGGGEFGEAWHRAGMLANKQNVFDDFIAAGEWLIKERWTTASRLGIAGGSNGGLLVGAAMVQRPELFRAVLCQFPLLDMVRYHRFLVARFWIPEYGSSEDADQFRTLYAYSPYHHVKAGAKYPAVLLVSGDADTRVAPLHARKMTALLQASTGSGRPVLLRYETHEGHSAGEPVSATIASTTDEVAFMAWQLGLTPDSGPRRP